MKTTFFSTILFALLLTVGCTDKVPFDGGDFNLGNPEGTVLFIISEGSFGADDASLSYYDTPSSVVTNGVFATANEKPLGNTAQSMTIHGDTAWIVVNGSKDIVAIDTKTLREKGRITGFTSPRYIHFVSDEKAYVTELSDKLFVVNPATRSITKTITVPGMNLSDYSTGSTEQMVAYGKYLFVNCWSYQQKIIKIDTETDEIVAELKVGEQPQSMVLDTNDKLWVLTDGGLQDDWVTHIEAPALHRIDAATFTVEESFDFDIAASVSELQSDGEGENLYFINGDVFKMSIADTELPTEPFIPNSGEYFYALTVDPETGNVYVSDAADFTQRGTVIRYSPVGDEMDSFTVGIGPGAFCWF